MHFFAGNKVFVCFLLFVVCPFSDIRLEARVQPIEFVCFSRTKCVQSFLICQCAEIAGISMERKLD